MWKIAIVFVLAGLLNIWREMDGIGFDLGASAALLIAWVDNLWLFARTENEMLERAQLMCDTLAANGLRIKPTSMKYFTTSTGQRKNLLSLREGYNQVPVPYTDAMLILGGKTSCGLSATAKVKHRLNKGTSAFFAEKAFFCSKDVPIASKRNYAERIIP